jgi:hypothetical protein
VTMQALANTATELAEALHWGRQAVALLRTVGDQMYAANTLFIMAQRSMYAGIADDEVERWLVESRALAEAAGSEDDRAHAAVGFAQLAWLRGDHDGAAQLMDHALPVLRRLGDERCTGRALHILGAHARERGDLTTAEKLLSDCVQAVARGGQSVVLVKALDALADTAFAGGRLRAAAVLLGAAHTARESASAHLRPIDLEDGELRHDLIDALGASDFDTAYHEGERLTATHAVALALAT